MEIKTFNTEDIFVKSVKLGNNPLIFIKNGKKQNTPQNINN